VEGVGVVQQVGRASEGWSEGRGRAQRRVAGPAKALQREGEQRDKEGARAAAPVLPLPRCFPSLVLLSTSRCSTRQQSVPLWRVLQQHHHRTGRNTPFCFDPREAARAPQGQMEHLEALYPTAHWRLPDAVVPVQLHKVEETRCPICLGERAAAAALGGGGGG
jgi:hypothetical protein